MAEIPPYADSERLNGPPIRLESTSFRVGSRNRPQSRPWFWALPVLLAIVCLLWASFHGRHTTPSAAAQKVVTVQARKELQDLLGGTEGDLSKVNDAARTTQAFSNDVKHFLIETKLAEKNLKRETSSVAVDESLRTNTVEAYGRDRARREAMALDAAFLKFLDRRERATSAFLASWQSVVLHTAPDSSRQELALVAREAYADASRKRLHVLDFLDEHPPNLSERESQLEPQFLAEYERLMKEDEAAFSNFCRAYAQSKEADEKAFWAIIEPASNARS